METQGLPQIKQCIQSTGTPAFELASLSFRQYLFSAPRMSLFFILRCKTILAFEFIVAVFR
ncbi:hypothetical protein CLOSTMETH_02058 [[Clostridium] methylpentosum DSM 5476]|uniref:Uncharacterized protein n=1 Tax=[Clostridium] methylpentosum DSM 5476 TaxID=537013 RepID=C0EDX9_9FIRM|nr:hypothetical protein CLOSTMETH_02058 [[Clostridium] methylpentosum DSM 5476]